MQSLSGLYSASVFSSPLSAGCGYKVRIWIIDVTLWSLMNWLWCHQRSTHCESVVTSDTFCRSQILAQTGNDDTYGKKGIVLLLSTNDEIQRSKIIKRHIPCI